MPEHGNAALLGTQGMPPTPGRFGTVPNGLTIEQLLEGVKEKPLLGREALRETKRPPVEAKDTKPVNVPAPRTAEDNFFTVHSNGKDHAASSAWSRGLSGLQLPAVMQHAKRFDGKRILTERDLVKEKPNAWRLVISSWFLINHCSAGLFHSPVRHETSR